MRKISFWVSLILIVATFLFVQQMHLGTDVFVWKKNLDKIPSTIDGMKGIDIPLEQTIINELDPDVFVYRNYLSSDGRTINVYIGYYGTSKGGRSRHTPEGCYPGSGWAILNESKSSIHINSADGENSITLNTIQVKKGDEEQLVYHWYQSDKSLVIVNGIQHNLNRFRRRLLYNRDDGAFIRVSMDVMNSYSETREYIESFISKLFPLIIEFWPEERNS